MSLGLVEGNTLTLVWRDIVGGSCFLGLDLNLGPSQYIAVVITN
jgi:hypothetical protein